MSSLSSVDGAAYAFVSYSRSDETEVLAEIAWIREAGFNIWYDATGIGPGHSWPKELAAAVRNCTALLFFATDESLGSDHCFREVSFALECNKPLLVVHLKDTKLSDEWQFSIGDRQALLKPRLSEADYIDRLTAGLSEHLVPQPPTAVETKSPNPVGADTKPKKHRSLMPRWLPAMAVVSAIAIVGAYLFQQQKQSSEQERWLTQEALPALRDHIVQDRYGESFRLAQRIERAGFADYITEGDWQQLSVNVDINSEPQGAAVYFRLYTDDVESWYPMGETPITAARLPRDLIVLKLEKPGFEPAIRVTHSPGVFTRNAAYDYRIEEVFKMNLLPAIELVPSTANSGMVSVPDTDFPLHYPGFSLLDPLQIPAFDIGRDEVTNREFKAFVDAGGYHNATWWHDLDFSKDGESASWTETVASFTDQTGQPGPATWEYGTYPEGRADYPVAGISWFEAAAYARSRDQDLPTLPHWIRAALMLLEVTEPISPQMLSTSNFSGELLPAGAVNSLGPYGTRDMAGNVREWISNPGSLGDHVAMGGAYSEPSYTFYSPIFLSPFDRSAENGMRLVSYPTDPPAAYFADVPDPGLAVQRTTPVSEAQFWEQRGRYTFPSTRILTDQIYVEERAFGVLRKLQLKSESGSELLPVYVYLPDTHAGPFDAVIYNGGLGGFASKHPLEVELPWMEQEIFAMLLRTGRAVVWPVFYSSFERYDTFEHLPLPDQVLAIRERRRIWQKEVKHVLDYLEQSNEFSGSAAYMGLSYGAAAGWSLYHGEPRLKALIQLSGGIPSFPELTPQLLDYMPRIDRPVLQLNGRADYLIPFEEVALAHDLLATPADKKRLVGYDVGHWPLPPNQMRREVLLFLDEHLGPST